MSENNTTVTDCIEDCVEAASSSLFDDLEVVLVSIAALLGIAAWAIKKYKALSADGKITLDEIIDSIDEVKEKAAEVEEHLEDIEEVAEKHIDLDKLSVAELKDMLKEKGLPVGGKKADLIARLEAPADE